MRTLRERVEQDPVKYYLLLVYVFTAFFLVLLGIIGGTTFVSANHLVGSMFNSTNVSTMSSDISTFYGFHINLDFLAAMITLFGGFGGFCYLFFSIRDNKFSQKDEFQYAFEGFSTIILFLDVFLFVSLFSGTWQTQKIIEIFYLIAFPLIAVIFAIPFIIIFNSIEENYEHRISIINFLRKSENKIIISPKIDPVSRAIFKSYETFSVYIFILLIGMIFYGILQDFNPITIISMILFSLIIFSGYARLISLKSSTSDIELLNRGIHSSNVNNNQSCHFSNVFILKESVDYFTILTNRLGENKIFTLSKGCICTIRDNEYEIFKEKTHPLAIWILTRTVRIVLTMVVFYAIFEILVYFIPTKQNWILFFAILIVSLFISVYSIHRMKMRVDDRIEKLVESIQRIIEIK